MSDFIKQFMWAYQHVLRITVVVNAERLFKEIGWEVKPQAFLVGVRAPDEPDDNLVCIEPEGGKWPFAPFAGLYAAVAEAIPKHSMQSLFFGDDAAMREKPENIHCAVVSEQVQQVVSALDAVSDSASFVSRARRVGAYYVVAVLQVPKAHLSDSPTMSLKTEESSRTTSFLHCCTQQILDQVWDLLGTREPGHSRIDQSLNAVEHARRAAAQLLFLVSTMTAKPWEGLNLFAALNDISTLMYERQEPLGHLLLVNPSSPNVEYVLKLSTPVPLREVRWSRKLVQLAFGDVKLICDGESIFGVGRWIAEMASVFEVEFFAQRSWTLRRGTQEFLRSHFGDPKLPRGPISKERFLESYAMHFPDVSSPAGDHLWEALKDLEGLDHGSLLIVAEDAAEEAVRLNDQGTVIEPTSLTSTVVESASRIDGAILADPEGRCHAVGVIVDGSAKELGSPSRGGRYNAALRYVLTSSARRMAIVISDDRTLDVIPLLPKRVSRNAIERTIDQLESATFDNYHESRNFLEAHRFYLNQEHCDRINSALARIHSEPRKWNAIVITSAPFEPHPAMEPHYWLDE